MKRYLLLTAFCIAFLPAPLALAKDVEIFKQANNPANYIRLDEIKDKKAETLQLNHPYTFTEDQMADIMRSLRYNRKALFSNKVKNRNVYEEEYVEKFAPLLVKAFAEVQPNQVVNFSIAQKRPWVIIRNDKLTAVRMWVTGNELTIDFLKTEAQLLGDYQANTQAGQKQINDAKGLRITLEPQEGQKFSFDTTDKIILDLNTDWEKVVDKIEEEDARLKAEEIAQKSKRAQKKYTEAAKPAQSAQPAQPVSSKDQKTAEDRLGELKKLKDKGLITPEDYEKKKQEILQSL